MPRLPPLPELDFADGAPRSRDHDDVYFSGEGLAEKRTVFLGGCGLPGAWAGRDHFTVGELGFGTGLNLLAAWDLWRRHRPSSLARLDYLSFEGALMPAEAAAGIHALWPELADLSRILLANWPARARGIQRIHLPDNLALTLIVDDIAAALPEARAAVDAWFLDGFAPSKNPAMWSAEAMAHVARLSAPNARAATYTVAGDVRRNLEAAGFAVEKKRGHGRKKERLEAVLGGGGPSTPGAGRGERPLGPRPLHRQSVTIIGAGIAGACAAHAFLKRGCAVSVIDEAPRPGGGASGNPLALVMPRLDAADAPVARGLLEAWLYARRFYPGLGDDVSAPLEAAHRPRGEKEQQRFSKVLADPPLDETILQPLDAGNSAAGMRHLGAVAIRPAAALPRLLDGATLCFNTEVDSVDEVEGDLIIVCTGMDMAGIRGLASPPMEGRLGQLERAPSAAAPRATADGGYVVEAFGHVVFGATFEAAQGEPRVTEAARAQNLETLARLRPDLAAGLSPETLSSRASIRATTPDRFPFAGAPPNEKAPDADPAPSKSIRLLGGLGARGFLWAPLLAELLASEVFDEPSPVEASVAKALDPGRFLHRTLRRGEG